ncbi:MAG: M48 family metalloprotease [Candidatus Muiribacteriota bacterium]
MKCTGCGSENFREVLTTNGVLIDFCDKCGGIWLDKGEIFFFTKSPSYLKFKIDQALKNPKKTDRKNPKTGGELVEISLFDGKLDIDYDIETEGIYLDKGELDSLPGFKDLKIEIKIDNKVLNPNLKNSTDENKFKSTAANKSEPKKKFRAGLSPLPSLSFISSMTFIGLYGLLGLFFVIMAQQNIIPEAGALIIFTVILFLQFLLSPFIMDFMLNWFYKCDWVGYDSLPEPQRKFIQKISAENNIKIPRMGVIRDGSPNAFTYGHTPNNARIVITSGMFDLLDDEELNGVIAHEVGHAVHWDMLLMTVLQLVPMFLYYVYRTIMDLYRRSSSRGRRGKKGGQELIVAIVAYVLYIISQYIVLYFSRVREYYADRFAGKYISPNKLASALVKIGYGLAGKKTASNEKERKTTLDAVKTMGIFDSNSARGFAMTGLGRKRPESMGGEVDKESLKGAMRWDMWNPWAKYFELHSTHPLIAKRLLALSNQSMHQGEEPYIEFNERQPESYWDEFFVDIFFYWLPYLGFFSMLGLAGLSATNGNGKLIAIGFMLWGLALFAKTWFSYKWDFFPELNIESLLKKIKVSPVRPVPVTIKGKIIGRGVPGLIWSEDFVIQDESGIIFLDYAQPLAIFNFLFGLLRAGGYEGEQVKVIGWYRRAPVPYIELKKIESQYTSSTCYVFHFKLFMSVALLIIGGVLMMVN